MLHLFRRKRLVINKEHYVHGEIFTPGALAFALVPTVADPPFDSYVNKSRNFKSLAILQPPLLVQNYVVPNGSNPGYGFELPLPNGLDSLAAAYDSDSAKAIPDNIYG